MKMSPKSAFPGKNSKISSEIPDFFRTKHWHSHGEGAIYLEFLIWTIQQCKVRLTTTSSFELNGSARPEVSLGPILFQNFLQTYINTLEKYVALRKHYYIIASNVYKINSKLQIHYFE